MIRITTAAKVQIAHPNQTWSLVPGANHFDAEIPAAVSERLAELIDAGTVTVDVLDGTGRITTWKPSIANEPAQ